MESQLPTFTAPSWGGGLAWIPACRGLCGPGQAPLCALEKRVQSPSQRFGGLNKSAAPSVKQSILALRQKIFSPPAPLVAVRAQGFVIFFEAGKLGLQGMEFCLDDAQAREERRLRLGRYRCVRHKGMMAPKGYRSAKIKDQFASRSRF
jgi:hypothetical protein